MAVTLLAKHHTWLLSVNRPPSSMVDLTTNTVAEPFQLPFPSLHGNSQCPLFYIIITKPPQTSIKLLMACTQPRRELVEFERVFQQFDEDGDGKISPEEVRRWLRMIGEDSWAEQVELLWEGNGESLIGFDELVRLVGVVGDEEGKTRELREAFGVFVMEEGKGCITPKSLRRALSRLGRSRSLEDCMVMIQRFDIDGDGVLSFEEFRNMMI